jgi:hypothetical protein
MKNDIVAIKSFYYLKLGTKKFEGIKDADAGFLAQNSAFMSLIP